MEIKGEMLTKVIQQFREEMGKKKGEKKRRGNASAVLHKRYAMCPC